MTVEPNVTNEVHTLTDAEKEAVRKNVYDGIKAVMQEFEEEYREDEAADVAEFVVAVMERLTIGQTWLLRLMLSSMLAAHDLQEAAAEAELAEVEPAETA